MTFLLLAGVCNTLQAQVVTDITEPTDSIDVEDFDDEDDEDVEENAFEGIVPSEDEITVTDREGNEDVIDFPEAMTYDLDSLLNLYIP